MCLWGSWAFTAMNRPSSLLLSSLLSHSRSFIGPCPPCAAMGPLIHCFCGGNARRSRCGVESCGYSCGGVCHKVLNCGVHNCEDVCHDGKCRPCEEVNVLVSALNLSFEIFTLLPTFSLIFHNLSLIFTSLSLTHTTLPLSSSLSPLIH